MLVFCKAERRLLKTQIDVEGKVTPPNPKPNQDSDSLASRHLISLFLHPMIIVGLVWALFMTWLQTLMTVDYI